MNWTELKAWPCQGLDVNKALVGTGGTIGTFLSFLAMPPCRASISDRFFSYARLAFPRDLIESSLSGGLGYGHITAQDGWNYAWEQFQAQQSKGTEIRNWRHIPGYPSWSPSLPLFTHRSWTCLVSTFWISPKTCVIWPSNCALKSSLINKQYICSDIQGTRPTSGLRKQISSPISTQYSRKTCQRPLTENV